MTQARSPQRGFTMIELLMALGIAGILAMIGAPAMGSLLARTRARTAEGALLDALQRARAAAVMHNGRVLVCPSQDGQHCDEGDNWGRGWVVALDRDRDGQPDSGASPFVVQGALSAGTRVVSSRGRTRIAFHPNGGAAGSNASFTICATRARTGKAVVLSNSGRIRIDAVDPARLQACLAATP